MTYSTKDYINDSINEFIKKNNLPLELDDELHHLLCTWIVISQLYSSLVEYTNNYFKEGR